MTSPLSMVRLAQRSRATPASDVSPTELHKDFAPIPTYPVVLPLKGAGSDVNLFADRMTGKPVPGLPALDPNRVVRLFTRSHTLRSRCHEC